MAKDAIYEGEREVRTFVDLYHGANVLIKKSEQDQRGSNFTTMGSLLLTAFTFEAYLNHLGSELIKFWDKIGTINVLKKYSVLCKELEIHPNFSQCPYQTLKILFKFRNAIAHGESTILKVTKKVNSQDNLYDHQPKTEWEEYCKLENAKRARKDVSEVITELHSKAGFSKFPFIDGMTISGIR